MKTAVYYTIVGDVAQFLDAALHPIFVKEEMVQVIASLYTMNNMNWGYVRNKNFMGNGVVVKIKFR